VKLYVWENVLMDYTSGIMFALANSIDEARMLIAKKYHEECRSWDEEKANRLCEYVEGEYGRCKVCYELQRYKPQVFDTPVGFYLWGGG
jgi:hypothetical protein